MNETSPDASSPNWALWPVYLFFRPGHFFRQFVLEPVPGLTAFVAWVFGMGGVIDRIATRMAMADLRGDLFPLGANWTVYWSAVAIGGVLAGALYYGIGGWWYRLRLKWCGVDNPDVHLARRVYIFASLVATLPIVVSSLFETVMYDSPKQAYDLGSWIPGLLLIACLFWSVANSYVGVRTVFAPRKGLAILWFLALPCVCYTFALGLMMAGFLVGTLAISAAPPDLTSPNQFNSPTLSFQYPGNWVIDAADPDYDPYGNILVHARQDATAFILYYPSELSLNEELDLSIEEIHSILQRMTEGPQTTQMAAHDGIGITLSGNYNGEPMSVKIFIAETTDNMMLELREYYLPGDRPTVDPGFSLIRSTISAQGSW